MTKLLTTRDLATLYGISPSTAAKMRMRGDGPAYVKLGRSVVYLEEDVQTWLQNRRVQSTAEAHRRGLFYLAGALY